MMEYGNTEPRNHGTTEPRDNSSGYLYTPSLWEGGINMRASTVYLVVRTVTPMDEFRDIGMLETHNRRKKVPQLFHRGSTG